MNNFPERVSEDTKQRVFQAAAQRGYLHPAVVKPQRRTAPRERLKAKALIKVYLRDGSLYSKCRGEVADISSSGMLLRSLEGGALLTKPFSLEIVLTNSKLQGLIRKARPIHFAHQQDKPGLGVQFFDPIEHGQLRKPAGAKALSGGLVS